jgi:hypothetical protein
VRVKEKENCLERHKSNRINKRGKREKKSEFTDIGIVG